MPLLVILLLAFLAGALLTLALTGLLGAERETIARRLDALARPAAPADPLPSLADAELEGGWRERLWQPILRAAGAARGAADTGGSGGAAAGIAGEGGQSGRAGGAGVRRAARGQCRPLPVCWPGRSASSCRCSGRGCCCWVSARLIGLTLPETLLEQAIRRRQALIRRALPDAIDLLVVSVEAGMGLDGAMAKVTEKMRGPLADETGAGAARDAAGQDARAGPAGHGGAAGHGGSEDVRRGDLPGGPIGDQHRAGPAGAEPDGAGGAGAAGAGAGGASAGDDAVSAGRCSSSRRSSSSCSARA